MDRLTDTAGFSRVRVANTSAVTRSLLTATTHRQMLLCRRQRRCGAGEYAVDEVGEVGEVGEEGEEDEQVARGRGGRGGRGEERSKLG